MSRIKTGLKPSSYDQEFEIRNDLLTAKHVDDINMGGTEAAIDQYTKDVERVFGKCKLDKHQFTNCAVQYTLLEDGSVVTDQDAYIHQLRPIVHAELTGAPAEKESTKNVSDQFVSLRGALAYTTLTQSWIQVYIVALQRVQQPTNLDVRRLNAVTRKLQKEPQKQIFPAMECSRICDIHTDSGYRRMEQVDDVKGYGMRGMNLIRRGQLRNKQRLGTSGKHGPNTSYDGIHLIESICKSHKLTIRSSYGAEALAAAHGVEDAYPSLITLMEIRQGVMTASQLKECREKGTLKLCVMLTIDAESVYKSLTSRELKAPAEKTLLGHISWLRELLSLGIINNIQWCDTRDMTADGHTKGIVDRKLLLDLMSGIQIFTQPVKCYSPNYKSF